MEEFKIALCLYAVPEQFRDSPSSATDIFEFDRSQGVQQSVHFFNHFSMSTQIAECGSVTYSITNQPSFVTWVPSSDSSVLH